jgi:hypothetical protein
MIDRFTEFDKLNSIKLGYSGKVFGSGQFSLPSQVPEKLTLAPCFKSGQKRLKNYHLAL